jgi:DNA-binding Lrp family transcriptional regulator
MELQEKQKKILRLLQSNGKLSSKDITKKVGGQITTVYARIKKMEELGIIKGYKAILDPKKLGKPATGFVFTSLAYPASKEGLASRKKITNEIANYSEVQEVHVITGDWDILIKIKGKDVAEMSNFVMNKIRTKHEIEKTLTCIVFETAKETMDILI